MKIRGAGFDLNGGPAKGLAINLNRLTFGCTDTGGFACPGNLCGRGNTVRFELPYDITKQASPLDACFRIMNYQ